MSSNRFLTYLPRSSSIHKLTGSSKLVFFLLFSFSVMLTYDTRVLAVLVVIAITLFPVSRIRILEVKGLFVFVAVLLLINSIFLFVFNPEWGTEVYGTRHVLLRIFWRYDLTAEQLFFQINYAMKYFAMMPIAVLFISTTDPSEFAASLNSIGISYRVSYAVAIALRYIPDIQRDYHNISQAQQARGVELGKNEKLGQRMKNSVSILLPLLLSSLNRIDVISSAMELRGFGRHKRKRTWYKYQAFRASDWIVISAGAVILILSLIVTYSDGNRFFNPFIL